MVRFDFEDIPVMIHGVECMAKGSGLAEVLIWGNIEFYPGVMTLPNGDPGYPDEYYENINKIEFNGYIELEEIDVYDDKEPLDIDIDEYLEEHWEDIQKDITSKLDPDKCSFNEDDVSEQLREDVDRDNY